MKNIEKFCTTCTFVLIFIAIFMASFSVVSESAFADDVSVFYITTTGSAEGNGSKEMPFDGLETAKNYLIEHKSEINGEVCVYFKEGTYRIGEVINFTESDLQNVTYKAFEGETVRLVGSEEISGFQEGYLNGIKVFSVDVGNRFFRSVFKGEKALPQTRYPEEGYLEVTQVYPEDDLYSENNTPWEFTLGQTTFGGDASLLPNEFYNMGDVAVRIFHYWKDETCFMENLDPSSGKVTLNRPSTMKIATGDRFYLSNVKEALNTPGEWYLDSLEHKLFYVPAEGENAEDLTLEVAATKKLIYLDNCQNIKFERLCFENTDWELVSNPDDKDGMDSSQAAFHTPAVIQAEYSVGIDFINCEFKNLNETALKIGKGCKNCRIKSNIFNNIGGNAVFVGGENCQRSEPDFVSDIIVFNNHISAYGRIYNNAIGVFFTFVADSEISHNEIHDGYYTAISCGWVWGYDYHATENIKIDGNLIYDIGQDKLSDMGGIYMLGVQHGTEITNNVIHNVSQNTSAGGYGGWGIYLDEGSSYMLVKNNLCYCCSAEGLNLHYGTNNEITNNISAFNAQGQVSCGSHGEDANTATFHHNIYITEGKVPIYIYMLNTEHFSEYDNLMWNASGDKLYFATSNESSVIDMQTAKLMGFLSREVTENPLFADLDGFDFTLAENSPAIKMGFVPFNPSDAGTIDGTVIGLSEIGGTTLFAEKSYKIPYQEPDNYYPINTVSQLVFVAIALLCFALAMALLIKNPNKKNIVLTICIVATCICSLLIYGYFVEWDIVAYTVCGMTLGLISGLACATAVDQKKHLFIVAVPVAIIFGCSLLFNQIFNVTLELISNSNAINLALLANVIFMLSVLIRKLVKKSK